jgi:hypothetical protein
LTAGRGRQAIWARGSLVIAPVALLVAGCITGYAGYPDAVPVQAQGGAARPAHFTIQKFDILNAGGDEAIEETLLESPAFTGADRLYEDDPIPDKGLLVTVSPDYLPPSLPGVIFGYLSVSTLTILPAYSGKDGYRVTYRVSVDGEPAGRYRYEIRRKIGIWLPLLPFIWVNLMTSSERDAFHATTSKFLADAHADGLL